MAVRLLELVQARGLEIVPAEHGERHEPVLDDREPSVAWIV